MDPIQLRRVEHGDLEQLQEIARATFSSTFAEMNTAEDMQSYLEESLSSEKLAAELDHPGSQFYFALDDGRPIGYLKINTQQAQTELQDDAGLEIERIYVLECYHGKKIGQLLYEKALQVAVGLQVDYVWLGVWEENAKAIRFYTKNGFIPFDKHIFRLGNDEQTDIMMKKKLSV